MWCRIDIQGDECSGNGDHADTQPDVPLLLYVRLRTPGVPQSRNSGSPAHSLTKSARRNTQFGPIPRPATNRKAVPLVLEGDEGRTRLNDALIVLPRRARAHTPNGVSLYAVWLRFAGVWGGAKRRAGAQSRGSSDPMRAAGAPSTGIVTVCFCALCLPHRG